MVRNHKDINKIKFGIFFTVIILAFTFFLINSFIINQLRNELNNQVKTIANIYHEKLTNENVDSQYLLDTLLPLINELQIPMIISTKKNDGSFTYQHLNLKFENDSNIKDIVYRMDRNNNPLTVMEIDGNPHLAPLVPPVVVAYLLLILNLWNTWSVHLGRLTRGEG